MELHGATEQHTWNRFELGITSIALHNQIYIVIFQNSIMLGFAQGELVINSITPTPWSDPMIGFIPVGISYGLSTCLVFSVLFISQI